MVLGTCEVQGGEGDNDGGESSVCLEAVAAARQVNLRGPAALPGLGRVPSSCRASLRVSVTTGPWVDRVCGWIT